EMVSALREMGLSAGEVDIRSRGLEAVLRTLRDAQIDVVDAARLVDSRNAAALITLAEGVDEWKAMTEAISGSSGRMREQVDILDGTLDAAWKRFTNNLKDVGIAIGELGLTDFLTGAADAMGKLAKATSEFAENMK